MRIISIIGWYGHSNIGDEGFRAAFERLLPKCRLDFVRSAEIGLSDTCILGGGDVLSTEYFARAPAQAKLFAIGVGLKSSNDLDTLVANKERIQQVWARNKSDVQLMQQAGLGAAYCPDITFLLVQNPPKTPNARAPRVTYIGSKSLEVEYRSQNDSRRLAAELSRRAEIAACLDTLTDDFEIEMLPMCFDPIHYDLANLSEVLFLMQRRHRCRILDRRLDFTELVTRLSASNVAIVQRFHGLIACVAAGIPFVACTESRKVREFCVDHGLEEAYLPFFSSQDCVDRIRSVQSDSTRQKILNAREMSIRNVRLELSFIRAAVQDA